MISSFSGKYAFLSNFYPAEVKFNGIAVRTVEHAFQASKTVAKAEQLRVLAASSPGAAKRAGRRVTLRPDWESTKLDVMRELLLQKFQIPYFREALLATGDEELVESNTWHDTYWGVCNGVGENHLGKLLMSIREELHHD